MSLAVAECTDPAVTPLFAHHYAEEYDHGDFFMRALESFGLSREVVLASRPLPSTLGVLNYMRLCARRDPLEYAICSGFLESTGTDRARAKEFIARLATNYAVPSSGSVGPLLDHLNLDEEYGHGDLFEAICDRTPPLTVDRASTVLTAGAALVDMLELWSTDIERTYAANGSVPRRSLHVYRTPWTTSAAR